MKKTFLLFGLLVTLAIPSGLWAQGYSQTNLVSNVASVATTTDANLSNPWGISFIGGDDFWIANNFTGTSTLYNAQGVPDSLVVTIPGASSNPNGNCSPGCPTGTVANSNATYFGGGQFIFDTEDGLIASWSAGTAATVAFDNSKSGAVYTGLAMLGTNLLAANFNSGKIDVYDSNFTLTSLAGSFTDPNLPAGFAPHGVHVINNQVYIAYAMQNAAKHNAMSGAGLGQVDIFDASGNFVSVFVTAGATNNLNAPWGVVATPASFGTFASDILIGNFGDGTMSAFDPTGKFLGQITNSAGTVVVNPRLWDMVFGAGGTGDPGTLYFTAGSATSVFASMVPASSVTTPGFSLSLSAPSTTVGRGGSANLTVGAAAVGGFNGQITLTCNAPSGLTCAFAPSTISPGASPATLTITAAATPPSNGGYIVPGMGLLLPGLGLFGTLLTAGKRKPLTRKSMGWMSLLGLLLVVSLFAVGCGGGSSGTPASNQPPPSSQQVTVMVTGTSGSLTQTAPVTVTIN